MAWTHAGTAAVGAPVASSIPITPVVAVTGIAPLACLAAMVAVRAIEMASVVASAVVRMTIVIVRVVVHVVVAPRETEHSAHAPEKAVVVAMVVVGVVVDRVRIRVVVVHRPGLVDDHLLGLIAWQVDDLRISRHDRDGVLLDADRLAFVRLEIACVVGEQTKLLYRGKHVFLLLQDRLAQRPSPLQIFVQKSEGLWVVQQRHHGLVPILIRFGRAGGVFAKACGRNDLERVGRSRQDDGDEIVGVQRDGSHELEQLCGRQRLDGLDRDRPIHPGRLVIHRRRAIDR
jgi:hypothetical protein